MSEKAIFQDLIEQLKNKNFEQAEIVLQKLKEVSGENFKEAINQRNSQGMSIYHILCESEYFEEQIKWLTKIKELDINATNNKGETPLFLATLNDASAIVDVLLKSSADPNIPNKDNITPILRSVLNKKGYECFELLINSNADVNLQSKTGANPILVAAIDKKAKIFQKILEKNPDLTIKDEYGTTILYAAIASRSEEIFDYLIQYAQNNKISLNPNVKRQNGALPIEIAMQTYNLKAVEKLIELGSETNVKIKKINSPDETLLQYVINHLSIIINSPEEAEENKALIEGILRNGANINERDSKNNNLIVYTNGNIDLLKVLVDLGLDKTRPATQSGRSAYDIIVSSAIRNKEYQEKFFKDIKELRKIGFPAERVEWDEKIDGEKKVLKQGNSEDEVFYKEARPLAQELIQKKHFKFVSYLQELGININEKASNTYNNESLSHAIVKEKPIPEAKVKVSEVIDKSKRNKILNIEFKENPKNEEELLTDIVNNLKSFEIDISWNEKDINGNTALHLAIENKNDFWIKWLLQENKANLNEQNNLGLNAVGMALLNNNPELAYTFIKIGKENNIDLTENLLPNLVLALSKEKNQEQQEAVIKNLFLLKDILNLSDKDIKPSLFDENQKNPMFVAINAGMHKVLDYLLHIGGNPNEKDKNGNSLLMNAVFLAEESMAKALFAMGANPRQKNNNNMDVYSVIDWNKTYHFKDIIKIPNENIKEKLESLNELYTQDINEKNYQALLKEKLDFFEVNQSKIKVKTKLAA